MTPFKVWRENTYSVSPNIIKLSRFFHKDLNQFEKHLLELAESSDRWLQFFKDTRDILKKAKSLPFHEQDYIERLFVAEDGEIMPIYRIVYSLDYVIEATKQSKKKSTTTIGDIFDVEF